MTKKRTPYMFIMPALVIIIIVSIIPIIFSLILAFGDYNGMTGYTFEGLDNFVRLANDPYFSIALVNIAILLIFTVPMQIIFGLLLANILNMKFIRGKAMFRTVSYFPVITSGVAVAFLFGQLLSNDGLLNNIIVSLGGEPLGWLQNPFLARVSMILIIVWKRTGYYVTIFLAALQSVPESVYEAADLDGAIGLNRLCKITIPLLKPVIFFSVIMATIWGLNTFEVPNILFGSSSGPDQVALMPGIYLYDKVITTPDYGYASAIAWVMAIISLLIAWFQFKVGDKDE